ncbi:hypothetical protein MRX96_028911 [Rhipicephalus microplus]
MMKYKTLKLCEKVASIEKAEKSTCTETQFPEKLQMSLSMLSTILKNKEKLENMALGMVNYHNKQSNITDYFK